MGNGESTCYWDDKLLGNGLLLKRSFVCMSWESNNNFLVSDKCFHGEQVWIWNRPLREGDDYISILKSFFMFVTGYSHGSDG